MGHFSLWWRPQCVSCSLPPPLSTASRSHLRHESIKSFSSPSQRETRCRVLSLGDTVGGRGAGRRSRLAHRPPTFYFFVTKPKAIGVCLLTASATHNPCSSQSRRWIPTCPTCSPEHIASTSLLDTAEAVQGSMPPLAGWRTLTTACCCHTTLLAA